MKQLNGDQGLTRLINNDLFVIGASLSSSVDRGLNGKGTFIGSLEEISNYSVSKRTTKMRTESHLPIK